MGSSSLCPKALLLELSQFPSSNSDKKWLKERDKRGLISSLPQSDVPSIIFTNTWY